MEFKYENKSENEMSQSEIELLKSSWAQITDKDELGIRLMIKLFQADNDIKYLWIFASNLEIRLKSLNIFKYKAEEKMRKNSEIIFHAKKMTSTIEKILSFLNTTNQTEHICYMDQFNLVRMGKRHFHYGLKREYFQCFEESLLKCLEECLSDEQFHVDTRKAWIHLNNYIFDQLERGMQIIEKENEQREKIIEKLKNGK